MIKLNKKILQCQKIIFHSAKDQEAFWEWVKKISAIEEVINKKNLIFFRLKSSKVNNITLYNFLGLFYRYNIEMQQLSRFLTKDNKKWFYDNKKAFWHKKVFKK